MKKVMTLLLAALLALSLAACGGGNNDPVNSGALDRDDNGSQQQEQQTQPPANTEIPGNTSDNGDGEILTDGKEGLAPPANLEMPDNVKLVLTNESGPQETIVKIGNDYYYNNTLDNSTIEKYFKYDSAQDTWSYYKKVTGTSWQLDEENYDGGAIYEDVMAACFGYTNLYQQAAAATPDDTGITFTSTGRSQRIAGVDTKEYCMNGGMGEEYFWIADSGVCLKYSGMYETATAITWDTSVTSFGYDVP